MQMECLIKTKFFLSETKTLFINKLKNYVHYIYIYIYIYIRNTLLFIFRNT